MTANRFSNIIRIADEIEHCIVQFSTGMDSVVMLHLFETYMPGRYTPVHMHYVAGLSWTEKVITHYERRYGVTVRRFTHPLVQRYDSFRLHKQQRRITLTDMDNYIREKIGCEYIAYGFMKADSIFRRGQLALKDHTGVVIGDHGIDRKYKKCFPIAEWTKKDIVAYQKRHKLVIPETYEIGFRDCTCPDGGQLIMIKNNYPADFGKIIKRFPYLRAEHMRQQAVCDGC